MAKKTAAWGWAGGNYHELASLEVWIIRQDILNNRTLFGYIIGNNSNNSYGDTGTLSYTLKDQSATRYSGSRGNTPTSNYNQAREYARGEFWISHNNSTGVLSERTFVLNMSRTAGNIKSVSIDIKLSVPTIPRGSSVTALNNVTLPGGTPTFTIAAHNTSYRHVAYLKVDGATIATMSNLAAGTHSFDLTQAQITNILNRIPNDIKKPYEVVITTLSGTNTVGTSSSKTATVNVANSVVPVISKVTVTNYVGDSVFNGPVVQNKSQISIAATRAGVYNSKIVSVRIDFNGITYNGNVDRTPIIYKYGDLIAKVTVTDTRGRTATVNETVVVRQYERPTITGLWANRAYWEMGGKPPMPIRPITSPEGKYLSYGMYFDISPLNDGGKETPPFNTARYGVMYRKRGDDLWTELKNDVGFEYWFDYQRWATDMSDTEILSIDSSYEVKFWLSDMFESLERTVIVSTAHTLIDVHSSGEHIAFGKVSEARGFEVNMPVYAYQEMKQNDGARVVDEHNMHELTSKGICLAGVGYGNSNNFTMTINRLYHNEPIPMDYIPLNSGDTFTKEGIYFRVNRDCIIEVVANIYTAGSSNSTTTGGINKITNGSTTRIAGFVATTPTTGYQYNSCTAVLKVKAGDLLYAFIQAQKAGQTVNVRWETAMIIKQI